MRLKAIVSVVVLGMFGMACESSDLMPGELASEEELALAQGIYHGCLQASAEIIDDGISDAASVGAIVAQDCVEERNEYIETATRGQNRYYAYGAREGIMRSATRLGTEAVLIVRQERARDEDK